MITSPDNDNNRDEPMVFIVIAKAYETEGGQPEEIMVQGGFAEVSATGLTVLAEHVEG